ncbi:NUDIX family hydrolase [Bacillus methanolicus PB1]|uniref:NUDIX family hydrolase n=1 Tax=Bacillus methanolicus PB1 TaxID=997296 RepID=I3DVG3_BACMT|nr:CoA pyrophosphatase [Bacillus methanolicus]EIJ78234.1 NUDIX family hydrolase [Bacillus methanolicus PB1]
MHLEHVLKKLQNRTPGILGGNQYSKFAVLLPLIEKEDDLHVLFEVRAFDLRRQPGEICFPGGKIESTDRNEQHTAIRETSEELGVRFDNIKNVYPLDYMVSPYGTIIYPFVGTIHDPASMKPNPSEVAEFFTVPISFFLKTKPDRYKVHFKVTPEENFPFHLIAGGENYNWQMQQVEELFYLYDGKVIWGLTARVLNHFLDVIRDE